MIDQVGLETIEKAGIGMIEQAELGTKEQAGQGKTQKIRPELMLKKIVEEMSQEILN